MSASRPHSTPGANQVLLRDLLEVMQACHDNTCADCKADLVTALKAFSYLEEQLEAAQKRLAWAARLLRYPDGADQFSIDCRNWLNDYYAASSPASESTP